MKAFFEKVKAFFKKLWQKIVANKLIAIVVAAIIVIGTSTAIVVASLSGGGNTPSDSSSSVESSEKAEIYTIKFESNGGTALQSIQVEAGTVVDLNEYKPEKGNSLFYGWCLDEGLTARVDALYTVESNVILYAEWGTEEMYVLTFETNGGSTIEAVSYRPNAYLLEPVEPTKENYAFGGWYKDAACTKEFSFFAAPQMPKSNLTIYAKWVALNGFIFETNGGSEVAPIYGATGDLVGEIEVPTKAGQIFEGWYSDAALKKAYDATVIPKGVVTLYAKWHDQAQDVAITLHFNYQGQDNTVTVYGNEGEALNASAAIASFTANITEQLKSSYLGDEASLASTPIYNFSAWAFDANGSNRFNGKVPATATDLYAVWNRSAAYCQVTFVSGAEETSYYVDKNTEIATSILDAQTADVKDAYEARGCTVDGFYTTSGSSYREGDKIAMDMRLIPYVYTSNLAYAYKTIITDKGAEVKGYALTGYDAEGAVNNASKENLLLLVPEYYNDGVHGQLPVIWVDDNAFDGYKVSEVNLPDSVYGIGKEAFAGATFTAISLPARLFHIGDVAFKNSALQTVEFNSSITEIGITVFAGTAYEATMPTDATESNPVASYIFFDEKGKIIYQYVGTKTVEETPSTVEIIAGGAFMGNTTIKSLELSNKVRQVGDYAFANSALETVKIGQSFAAMGVGAFKGCTSLTKVEFTFKYNLASLGTSMFEGCTALTDINVSFLDNLKTVESKAFFGCSALTAVSFGDSLTTVGESAFEGCTSLVYANFGKVSEEESLSQLKTINNRAFAGCTSLKRIVLRGEIVGTSIVQFKTNVFAGAGYMKNGSFVTPVIYVRDTYVDHWSNDDENGADFYSYVEIYKTYLPAEYRNFEVKAIDSRAPEASANGNVVLTAGAELAQFDLLSYVVNNNVLYYYDETSAMNCEVYVVTVVNGAGATLTATEGKYYNLASVGTYAALIAVEDEFGNRTDVQIYIYVNA